MIYIQHAQISISRVGRTDRAEEDDLVVRVRRVFLHDADLFADLDSCLAASREGNDLI